MACLPFLHQVRKSGEFYREYHFWSQRSGEFARSISDFYRALERRGTDRKRAKSGVVILGLRLREEEPFSEMV